MNAMNGEEKPPDSLGSSSSQSENELDEYQRRKLAKKDKLVKEKKRKPKLTGHY